jgi:tetratricopeptide (TPR) repeat protein
MARYFVASAYPDGQIFLSTRDSLGAPVQLNEILRQLLGALGIYPGVETSTESLLTQYREAIRGRKIIIIADDAAFPDTIAAITPEEPGSAVVVTARDDFQLFSDVRVALKPLKTDEARQLLSMLVGSDRLAKEPEAAEKIAEECQGFPSAVALVGEALSTRPYIRLSSAAGRRHGTPDAGRVGARSYRVLDLVYDLMPPLEQTALRSLRLLEKKKFAPWQLAAVAGVQEPVGWELAERLTRTQLVYRPQAELAEFAYFIVPEHVRTYVHRRWVDLPQQPEGLKARERVRQEEYFRRNANPAQLIRNDVASLLNVGDAPGALRMARGALTLAHELNESLGQSLAIAAISEIYMEFGRANDLENVLSLASKLTPKPHQAEPALLRVQCRAEARRGDAASAVSSAGRAVQIAQDLNDTSQQILALRDLALVSSWNREHRRARSAIDRALLLCETSSPHDAQHLSSLCCTKAEVLLRSGERDRAAETVSRSAGLADAVGHRLWLAWSFEIQADIAMRRNDFSSARSIAMEALELFSEMRHRYGAANVSMLLGTLYSKVGRHTAAEAALKEASDVFRNCGDYRLLAEAKERLSGAKRARRRELLGSTASRHLREVIQLVRDRRLAHAEGVSGALDYDD